MGSFGGDSKPQVQESSAAPWDVQVPYLKDAFSAAQQRFQSKDPRYYPGATYVPFSEQSRQGIDTLTDRATSGSPINTANSQYAQDVLGGNYLNANPYLDETYDRGASAMTRNYLQSTYPGIESGFNLAGRVGERGGEAGQGLRGVSHETALDNYTRGLADFSNQLYGGNYANERGNMQTMAALAPGIANQEYTDINQLLGAGGLEEQKAGEVLQDKINRWDFKQNIPDQKLDDYLRRISGNYGGTQSATTTPSQTGGSFGGDILGTGLQIASLGNPFTAAAAPVVGGFNASPSMLGICWVAREVYGETNPKWMLFRHWLLNDANKLLLNAYIKYGESFAKWLHNKNRLKGIIRKWMDSKIGGK